MLECTIDNKFGHPNIRMFENEALEQEAAIAKEMILRWGLLASKPDGIDKEGRNKLTHATPEEIVDRALSIAHLFMKEARNKGLILQLPKQNEIENSQSNERK
jgi:hypothetical protein